MSVNRLPSETELRAGLDCFVISCFHPGVIPCQGSTAQGWLRSSRLPLLCLHHIRTEYLVGGPQRRKTEVRPTDAEQTYRHFSVRCPSISVPSLYR